MSNANLSSSLIQLIRSSVPTFQAAELLVFLHHHPQQAWTIEAIVEGIQPVVIPPSAIQEYLKLFLATGLLRETITGFEYVPASVDLNSSVGELAAAYNERPVTLIRTIHSMADLKIQSFADSFHLKTEKPRDQE